MRSFSVSLVMASVFVFLFGCVERYYPGEEKLKTGILVINAHITDKPGIQLIDISRSSGLQFRDYSPESGAYAILVREDGETREFFEGKPGKYTHELDADFLQIGKSYRVEVITAEGDEYQSDFDKIRPVPGIDSIYYEVESIYQPAGDTIHGIRFYIDFSYDDEAYEFIRWELTETYELHNPEMEAFVFYNSWRYSPLPDSSNYKVCYITRLISDIYSMSTEDLNVGTYFRKPFGFVPNDKIQQKLLYKYSVQVRQLSLGPEAFHYWNELRKTSQGLGSVFDQQPALLESNICNIHDDTEKVLGFFSMSGQSEGRGVAEQIPGLDLNPYIYYCLPVEKGPGSNRPAGTIPAYFARATYDGQTVFAEVNKHCVDCRAYRGSSELKPDFW